MVNPVESLFKPSSAPVILSHSFKIVIEDHLEYFRNHPTTTSLTVTGRDLNVYEFDWIGLLTSMRIASELHWIVIRLNGGMSYTDVPQDLVGVLVPDLTEFRNLIQMHTSSRKKK